MYGLIGRPLGHSFSASFFNNKFKNENIEEEYCLFPLESIEELPALIRRHSSLKGLNVTIPYKQEVIDFLDDVSEEAKEIGAVNVIKINRYAGIRLIGYNSDAIGFSSSIRPLLKPYMVKGLVLGTGGASKAVIYALEKLGIETLNVSRKRSANAICYDDLNEKVMEDCKVIVNTTPLGMWPNIEEAPPIPYSLLTPDHLLYDVVYNPEITEFMKRGKKKGATVKNGLEMLHNQALAAWEIWNA